MSKISPNSYEPVQIQDVLKALNHELRRDIIIYLSENPKSVSFSDLQSFMDFSHKSSGQFAYHLKLLLDSNLVLKNSESKYTLTTLGKKANEILSLTETSEKESTPTKITNAFKNLSPAQEIYLSYQGIPVMAFALSLSLLDTKFFDIYFSAFLVLIFFISLMIYVAIAYSILHSLLALITLSSSVWLVFLPHNHKYLASIYFSSLFGLLFFFQDFFSSEFSFITILKYIIGAFLILASILVSVIYYKKENTLKD